MQKRWKDQLARRFPRIAAPIRNFFRRLRGKPLVSASGEPLIPRGRKELPAQMRVDSPLTREFLAGLELCMLDDPVVSLVIVSYERPDFVENLIKSIWLFSDEFRYEIIVVENGSDLGKCKLVPEIERRASNGEQVHRLAGLAAKHKPSVDFSGYWQRHVAHNEAAN